MKKEKTFFSTVIALILFITASIPVFAVDIEQAVAEDASKGSISVTLSVGEIKLNNVEITIYRIADAVIANNRITFEYTDELKYLGVYPENTRDADLMHSIALSAEDSGAEKKISFTDDNGTVVFSSLEKGGYLVVQTGYIEGFTKCTPFIIDLPVEAEFGLVYDIDASPKNDIERLIDVSVKKIWNDGKPLHTNSVTVNLKNGGEIVDTAVLNNQNNWSYVWKNIVQSDSYEVEEVDIPKGYVASYRKLGNDFTVTNSEKLIQTGQNKWQIPVLFICGAFMFGGGLVKYNSGKRKEYE